MPVSATEQRGIIELLNTLYEPLRARELELGLTVGNGDFRPRIEYFHDAVRALTRANAKDREAGGRLCVEFLAYDVSALRYLAAMPLAPLNPGHSHLSPHTYIAVKKENALAAQTRKATRADKLELAEMYRNYALLFAALLKPVADEDFRDRVEEMNAQVEEFSALLHHAEMLGQGKGSEQQLRAALAHATSEEVQELVDKILQKQGYKDSSTLSHALKGLKDAVSRADRAIAGVETAHFQYVTAQLGIYEQGRDVVKEMATRGVNLAGRFTEASIAEQQGRTRGR